MIIKVLCLKGFIKSTDHRPTNHRPTDPPTHRPPTHRAPDALILFKRLEKQQDIHFTEHKHSWENIKRYTVYHLENLWSTGFHKERTVVNFTKNVRELRFLTSLLSRMEIAIRLDVFFFFLSW